jgi:hypothetical protein
MWKRRIGPGILAGLGGGAFLGALMTMVQAPLPGGGRASLMQELAMAVGADGLLAGWALHLVLSAAIGALFGVLFPAAGRGQRHGIGLGLLYGVAWWIVGGLVVLPMLLGWPAFAPLTDPALRGAGLGFLFGHVVFGATLGAIYAQIQRNVAEMETLPPDAVRR